LANFFFTAIWLYNPPQLLFTGSVHTLLLLEVLIMFSMAPVFRNCLLALSIAALSVVSSNFAPTSAQSTNVNPCQICISEFRTRGLSKFDEYVELFNNTNSPVTVPAGGWAVVTLGPSNGLHVIAVVPEFTVIPARAHYLLANNQGELNKNGYSLNDYAVEDLDFGTDILDDGAVGVFNNNAGNYTAANRFDAVGFAKAPNTANSNVLREGAGLPGTFGNGDNTPVDGNTQYSWVRKVSPVAPANTLIKTVDTGNNAADFAFVSSTAGVFGGLQSALGFPGPENLHSPISNGGIAVGSDLVDTTVGAATAPNQVRTQRASCPVGLCNNETSNLGTLTFRRKFTNISNQPITRLRFRLINMTTLGNTEGLLNAADLRALSDPEIEVAPAGCGGNCAPSNGSRVERAQSQLKGGGLNSSIGASNGVIDLSTTPLLPGQSIQVRFVAGVQLGGAFRFWISMDSAN
jgi:hypothetical protein